MNDISHINWHTMSDAALSAQIGNFIRHHRLEQNRSQEEVSRSAGISRSTLSLLERGEPVSLNSLIKVLRVLELLSIMQAFEVHEEISPIALLKLKATKRKKASPNKE